MITEHLQIEIKEVSEAPDYNKMSEKFTLIEMKKAIIVKKGMASGNPSVDIQCEDKDGNKFLIFAKGGIVSMLGAAVMGVQQKAENENKGH